MAGTRSRKAFRESRRHIPGGVNSPVRAFGAVGGDPPFLRSGKGACVTDLDGRRYLDYVCSWGPLILGHAHPAVVRAAGAAARMGTSFGAPTPAETALAKLIGGAIPSLEQVRLVCSGTEACMSAIRLARGYTRRDVVVKFAGGYHGHADGLLVRAGSGAATFGVPTSPGVPKSFARHTLVLPYNDSAAVRSLFWERGKEIACVIVEPVAGNMGVVPPLPGFLRLLRHLTAKHRALLIFDEVITGFRFCFGGAQNMLKIDPDLTTLGKIVGGGFPVGAYGGPRRIMKHMAPEGSVYQAGTLSGNPVAVAAGLAQLRYLRSHPKVYVRIENLARRLAQGLRAIKGVSVNRVGSMLTLFFRRPPVLRFRDAVKCDTQKFARFHRAMLGKGIYLPPSQFEAWFVSAAHTKADIDRTLRAAREVLG
ncbi:MAG: glutamate-1-semialdehyde 2,1-aminomutase [Planctomycetota bacterium]